MRNGIRFWLLITINLIFLKSEQGIRIERFMVILLNIIILIFLEAK